MNTGTGSVNKILNYGSKYFIRAAGNKTATTETKPSQKGILRLQ